MTLRRTASNFDDTCVRKFVNLVVTFTFCSCPEGVNRLCVVGTSLSPSVVCVATGIHVSVSVHDMLYSGRSEHRDVHAPEEVGSDTGVGRGSCGWSRILHPSSLSLFLVQISSSFFFFPLSSFFFFWVSILFFL
jgi:hypothetical protein